MNINGRGKNTPNKLTTQAKETLFLALKSLYEKLGKYITGGTDCETRMKYLLKFLPYIIPKGKSVSPESEEVRNIICQQLKPQFAKLDIYINQVPVDKRPKVLFELIKSLTPEQQAIVLDTLQKKKK